MQIVTSPLSAWGLLRGQLEFLRRSGFDVTVVSAPGPMLQQTGEREGVDAVSVDMVREPAFAADLRSLRQLSSVLRRIDPHIIQFSTPKAGLLGSLASLVNRVPIRVYMLRGLRADGFHGMKGRLLALLERIPCGSAHCVVCVSESLRTRAIELGICDPEKLRVLSPQSSNGVDCGRFQRNENVIFKANELRERIGLPSHVPVLAFVGRLSIEKGVAELIAAYQQLRLTHQNLHLLLVGPSETYRGLPDFLQSQISNDAQIVTTGMLEDTVPAYALADVVALPTYREGFPNVALEAAAMELPVVATRVTGCVDAVVDGVTGTLVPAREASSLADAIGRYLDDPGLKRAHGHAGRVRVETEFRSEFVWEALLQFYIGLLRERGLPLPKFEAMPMNGSGIRQINIAKA